MKRFICTFICVVPLLSLGKAEFYRVAWRGDPSTSAVICWNQVSGENPEVHYGSVDYGEKTAAYENRMKPTRSLDYREMNNHFARLENLKPDTAYYFVICDSEGVGRRLWFKTAPNKPTPFTFISGGDSRSNPEPRREGNKLVAKLRPLFVLFGGDYSGSGTSSQWKEWFADWQLTISEDGRIYPIIATHGNHENADLQMMEHLFDTPHPDQYFSMGIGGDMMRIWVLNSELEYKDAGKVPEQNAWIRSDLSKYPDVSWKIAAYHRPMRAHTAGKAEGLNRIKWWGQLFYDEGIDLVIESDTHMTKRTYPVRPSEEEGSFESFIRDDDAGFIFLGEGSWAAPKRPANDDKPWTMASGSFHQFKWVQAFPHELLIRTVLYDRADEVISLSDENLFSEPENMRFWSPESGKVLRVPFDETHSTFTKPAVPRTILPAQSSWAWSLDGVGWESGVAPLGYGDHAVVTSVTHEGEKVNSAYFLRDFEVDELEKVTRLFFDVLVDDGCWIKLNGKSVVRLNLPPGKITAKTHALKKVSGSWEKKYVPLPVDVDFLKAGVNRLEVQVFQHSPKSSDLIFDLAVRIKE